MRLFSESNPADQWFISSLTVTFRAAAPKGPMTYDFTCEEISPSLHLLLFRPPHGFKAQIMPSYAKFH